MLYSSASNRLLESLLRGSPKQCGGSLRTSPLQTTPLLHCILIFFYCFVLNKVFSLSEILGTVIVFFNKRPSTWKHAVQSPCEQLNLDILFLQRQREWEVGRGEVETNYNFSHQVPITICSSQFMSCALFPARPSPFRSSQTTTRELRSHCSLNFKQEGRALHLNRREGQGLAVGNRFHETVLHCGN